MNSFSNTKPNWGSEKRKQDETPHGVTHSKQMAAQESSSTVTVSRGHENTFRRHEPEGR